MKGIGRSRREFLAGARSAAIATAIAGFAQAQPMQEVSRTGDLRVLSPEDAQLLLRVCRRVIPLDGVSDAAYRTVVAALDASAAGQAAVRSALVDGAGAMRRELGDGWAAAPDEALDEYLADARAAAFLQMVRTASVPVFVALPEVWAVVGYEGESLSKGGYLSRGFNDLAWLPEPPADAAGPVP